MNDVQSDARLLSDDNLLEQIRHYAARSFHSVFWRLICGEKYFRKCTSGGFMYLVFIDNYV